MASPASIGLEGRKLRCSSCKHVWFFDPRKQEEPDQQPPESEPELTGDDETLPDQLLAKEATRVTRAAPTPRPSASFTHSRQQKPNNFSAFLQKLKKILTLPMIIAVIGLWLFIGVLLAHHYLATITPFFKPLDALVTRLLAERNEKLPELEELKAILVEEDKRKFVRLSGMMSNNGPRSLEPPPLTVILSAGEVQSSKIVTQVTEKITALSTHQFSVDLEIPTSLSDKGLWPDSLSLAFQEAENSAETDHTGVETVIEPEGTAPPSASSAVAPVKAETSPNTNKVENLKSDIKPAPNTPPAH